MNRRSLLTILAFASVFGGQAQAEDQVARILSELNRLGYTTVSVESTLLRRTRIVAQNDEAQREIIINPNTGEILRDLWTPITKTSSESSGGLIDDNPNGGSGGGHDGDGSSGHGGGEDGGGDGGSGSNGGGGDRGGDDGGDD